MIWLLL